MKVQRSVVSMVILLGLVLTACAVTPAPSTSAPVAAQETAVVDNAPIAAQSVAGASDVAVTIQNFAFDPDNLSVKTGTTITWTNMDSVNHTVTSDTGLFDSGDLGKGGTFSYTFDKAGVYSYHCTPHHANMQATITVTD